MLYSDSLLIILVHLCYFLCNSGLSVILLNLHGDDADDGDGDYGPCTVFRGMRNFEPSRGICLFQQNFFVSTEFCGIL